MSVDELAPIIRRTDPVIRFLKARLEEDDMASRVIHPGEERWRANGRKVSIAGESQSPQIADADTDQLADYIARFDPQRLRAEIAAKRGIIAAFENRVVGARRNEGSLERLAGDQLLTVEMAVRIAARAYADHREFDPAWRD